MLLIADEVVDLADDVVDQADDVNDLAATLLVKRTMLLT
jgi:hypothetical protein